MGPQNGSQSQKRGLLPPIQGGVIQKIRPLLRYRRPFSPWDSPEEVFLVLKNNTERRVEGWLTITPPPGWNIVPGKQLMIAIRAQGTISAEFYLSVSARPVLGPHLLGIKVVEEGMLLARAFFDFGPAFSHENKG